MSINLYLKTEFYCMYHSTFPKIHLRRKESGKFEYTRQVAMKIITKEDLAVSYLSH